MKKSKVSASLTCIEALITEQVWEAEPSHGSKPALTVQGLDLLEYAEHTDYDLVESTNPAFNKALVRINVFRSHRQA